MSHSVEILRNRLTYEINIVVSKDSDKQITDYEILSLAYKFIGRELIKPSNNSYWNNEGL